MVDRRSGNPSGPCGIRRFPSAKRRVLPKSYWFVLSMVQPLKINRPVFLHHHHNVLKLKEPRLCQRRARHEMETKQCRGSSLSHVLSSKKGIGAETATEIETVGSATQPRSPNGTRGQQPIQPVRDPEVAGRMLRPALAVRVSGSWKYVERLRARRSSGSVGMDPLVRLSRQSEASRGKNFFFGAAERSVPQTSGDLFCKSANFGGTLASAAEGSFPQPCCRPPKLRV